MLQRLTITILHAIRNPGKVPITFHGHLALQIGQGMFARIPRLALEPLPKPLPVLSQLRLKFFDLLDWYSPALGIKQTFFTMFMPSVVP